MELIESIAAGFRSMMANLNLWTHKSPLVGYVKETGISTSELNLVSVLSRVSDIRPFSPSETENA
jgi:hypothetical protein